MLRAGKLNLLKKKNYESKSVKDIVMNTQRYQMRITFWSLNNASMQKCVEGTPAAVICTITQVRWTRAKDAEQALSLSISPTHPLTAPNAIPLLSSAWSKLLTHSTANCPPQPDWPSGGNLALWGPSAPYTETRVREMCAPLGRFLLLKSFVLFAVVKASSLFLCSERQSV